MIDLGWLLAHIVKHAAQQKGGGATWPFNDQEKNHINIPRRKLNHLICFCSPHTFARIYKLATPEGKATHVLKNGFETVFGGPK